MLFIKQKADLLLRRKYAYVYTGLLLFWLALVGILLPADFSGPQVAVLLIGAIVFPEFMLRRFMAWIYGSAYPYAVYNYALTNHPVYGNCFRKPSRFHEVEHLVFDKFLLKEGAGRVLDHSENRAARVRFTVNPLGFRGQEFSPEKTAGLRIFCVGSSTTACDCNDDSEAWPAQLEERFRKAGHDVEVINAGVQGWYSYQDYLRVREEIVRYQPDVILLQQGWNEEFEFSSLSLGEKWRPQMVRNVNEQHHLCSPPNAFFSKMPLLSIYLLIHACLKRFVFLRNMSFYNPARWQVLKTDDYLRSWIENIQLTAEICERNNILLYNVDFPALVSIDDTEEDRSYYLAHSRLTELFAEYQAISKWRISKVLTLCEKYIPRIDVEFADCHGEMRMKLFEDEMHTTPEGNQLVSHILFKRLMADDSFSSRLNGSSTGNLSNIKGPVNEFCKNKINDPILDSRIDSIVSGIGNFG